MLFLTRRDADVEPLVAAQRELFSVQVRNLTEAADQAEGFERALLLGRLENTTAVTRSPTPY